MARWKTLNWTRYHSFLTEMAEIGHNIYVLQPPPMVSEETNFQEIDVEVHRNVRLIDVHIPELIWNRPFPLDKIFKKGMYSLLCLRQAREIVRTMNIDLMFLYNIPQYLLSRINGCKIVFDIADDYIDMLHKELGRLSNTMTRGAARFLLKKMVSDADYVVAVSAVLAEQWHRDVMVLPNGVSPEKAETAVKSPLRREFSGPVVGFIGSFEYFIDFNVILDAAQALPDITFLMVGRGRQWQSVRDEVAQRGTSNIILTGGVPHQDVFRYIDKMDICLNIFKKIDVSHAACPIKLFEYMIMGKPVISTRLMEIEKMNLNMVCYADDATELANQINGLVSDSEKRYRLGQAGRNLSLQRYTWTRIVEQFIASIGIPDKT